MTLRFNKLSPNIRDIWISYNGGKTYPEHIEVDDAVRYVLLNNGYTFNRKKLPKEIYLKSTDGTITIINTETIKK